MYSTIATPIAYNHTGYRFGFQGQEKDDEITGQTGSHLDFGARIYDSRIGRWLALDPLMNKYADLSPYNAFANNPIYYKDKDGKDHTPSTSFKGSRSAGVLKVMTTNNINSSILNKFNGSKSIVHLYWDVTALSNANAVTSPTHLSGVAYHVGLAVNVTYDATASEISLARTITHELIHAELKYLCVKYQGSDLYLSAFNTMGTMTQYLADFNNGLITQDQLEHNYMADYRRGDIKQALMDFDNANNIISRAGSVNVNSVKTNYTSEQFYEAMTWAGLYGTKAWGNLSQTKRDLYYEIIQDEQSGGNQGTATKKTKTKQKWDSVKGI